MVPGFGTSKPSSFLLHAHRLSHISLSHISLIQSRRIQHPWGILTRMSGHIITTQSISDSFGWNTITQARALLRQGALVEWWRFDIGGTRISQVCGRRIRGRSTTWFSIFSTVPSKMRTVLQANAIVPCATTVCMLLCWHLRWQKGSSAQSMIRRYLVQRRGKKQYRLANQKLPKHKMEWAAS